VRQALPVRASPTVAGELFQLRFLLEALAQTDVLAFPFKAEHTGQDGVPDFQFLSGVKRVAVEMAKVTTRNLEWARDIQNKLPEPPKRFHPSNFVNPEVLAVRLKLRRCPWTRFVYAHLSEGARACVDGWTGKGNDVAWLKGEFCAAFNSIVDGPNISGRLELAGGFPAPELIQVEGFEREETPRDRKEWLEEAFWEQISCPLNPTLSTTPFVGKGDKQMKRAEVVSTGFLVSQLDASPTIDEERVLWLDRVCAELNDKSDALSKATFQRGDENWLVLWDRLGTPDWDLERRVRCVAEKLAGRWQVNWFSRVFLQDEYFAWQVMFTPEGAVLLPNEAQESNEP
jgi:hypothetical protein